MSTEDRLMLKLCVGLLPLALMGCPATHGGSMSNTNGQKIRNDGSSQIINRPVGRPGWIPTPNRKHPSFVFVTGVCHEQPNIAVARRCAINDAKRQIGAQLGAAGARVIVIKGGFIKDEHAERRLSAGRPVHDGWVLVAYPRHEVRKEEARIANRVLLGVTCNTDTMGSCGERVPQNIEQGMTRAGMQPAPQRMESAHAADPTLAMMQASKLRAAKVLLAVVNGKFLASEDGEFYAQSACNYRVIDAISGKVLKSRRFGPFKSGHITRKNAVAKAIDTCIVKLEASISGGS
ncbi:MAG: hypothetical protein JRH20_10830 [Deltaproteobacteria bacterium]|nr:hypothetical protein [Deltaproteobacteria bacterium]